MTLDTAKASPDVIIIGAGPTGLALAIELGHRSINCLVVERNDRVGYAPRAKTTNIRTREHLRRWGIAETLAQASPFGIDYPSHIVFATGLAGPLITRIENAFFCAPGRDQRYSEHAQWVPQYKLEAVLLNHARSLPCVDVMFGHELVNFTQDARGVVALLKDDTGREHKVTSCYLVGADGARSVVRDLIGASMIGTYGLSRNYNTIFEAPGLAEAHDHGPAIMYWQLNDHTPSMIGPMDVGDRWFFMPTGLSGSAKRSDTDMADLIRRSTGIDLPYRILSSDEWVASRLLADRYCSGRAFLAGDACHLHPPFGGYGMNMGVADGVDLGWKLAAVLNGWGGAALLDSYEGERRPAHDRVLQEAEANHALSPNALSRPGIEGDGPQAEEARSLLAGFIQRTKPAEFHSLGVVLGYCCRDSPVIVDDGTQGHWEPSQEYHASATPGCIAPHRWLDDGRSLYDLFGQGFTLLHFGAKDDTLATIVQDARRLAVPLQVVSVDDPSLAALYGSKFVLIRPDQIVAWRGDTWSVTFLATAAGRNLKTEKREEATVSVGGRSAAAE